MNMLIRIRQLLAAPVFDDEEKTRTARVLNAVLLTLLVTAVLTVILIVMSLLYGPPIEFSSAFTLLAGVVLAVAIGGLLILARRGYVRLTSIVLLSLLWLFMTAWICGVSGIASDSSPLEYALIIVLAGLLLGGRGAVVFTLISALAVAGAFYIEISGLIKIAHDDAVIMDMVLTAVPVILVGLLLRYAVNSLIEALRRARKNELAQAEANRELQAVRMSLEQRVTERTQELAEMVKVQQHLLDDQQHLLETIQEMSTPVVPVMKGIIVLPLVGTIDSRRAEHVVEALLAGIQAHRARVALMDITGVPVVDTAVAQLLLQAAAAARLLGTEVVLVGIRPEVAQTIVGLGVDLSEITTRADLQSGVEYAQRALRVRGA
jgi:anti-anti-sigma regulatory factor